MTIDSRDHGPFFVKMTSTPRSCLTNYPGHGATGIAVRSYGKFLVTWDKDNPVCRDEDVSQLGRTSLTFITEDEYNAHKLKNESYVKAYIKRCYDLDIPETGVKLVAGQEFVARHFYTNSPRPIVYLGCRIGRSQFAMHDFQGIYFIHCVFGKVTTYDPEPLINHTFIECRGIDIYNELERVD